MSAAQLFQSLADGGPLVAAALVAAVAGMVSFASPCVLPLVPGFLGYVTGLTGVDLEGQRRGRVLLGAVLFVLGFSSVFIATGAAFGALGAFLVGNQLILTRWMGAFVVLMGLAFLGVIPGLRREARIRWRPAAGLVGAPLLGATFGLGWMPCTGPTLAVVLALATDAGTALRGVLLTGAYCFGLGLPFVLVALGLGRSARALSWLRHHRLVIARTGGVALVVVGVLLISGLWVQWIGALQGSITGWETPV